MSLLAPSNLLSVRGYNFSFDETTLRVNVGMEGGGGLDQPALVGSAIARQERLDWLWQWAYWLDREREPVRSDLASFDMEFLLRSLSGLGAREDGEHKNWLRIGKLPELPQMAVRLAQMKILPRRIRAVKRRQIHAYRQDMAHWLGQESHYWQRLAQEAVQGEANEKPFERELAHWRRMIDDGTALEEILPVISAIVATLSPSLSVARVKAPGRDNLIIMLLADDRDTAFSGPRLKPSGNLEGLDREEGEGIARQRIRETAYRVGVHISALLTLCHCNRNQVALAFMLADDQSRKTVFSLTFKAPQLATYRETILKSIKHRTIPDLPICIDRDYQE